MFRTGPDDIHRELLTHARGDAQVLGRAQRGEFLIAQLSIRELFDEPFGSGLCRCFLMHVDEAQEATLGFDPEEIHMAAGSRMLQELAWHELSSMREDRQASMVLKYLDRS